MMMKKELSLLLILLAGFALNSNAQDEQPERWTIKIDVQHKDIPLQEDLSIGQLGVSDVVRIRPFYSADIQYFLNKGEKRKAVFVRTHGNLCQPVSGPLANSPDRPGPGTSLFQAIYCFRKNGDWNCSYFQQRSTISSGRWTVGSYYRRSR